jgi:ABC-type branched-subunit amino acid transport system substrate-binding protein
MGMKKAAAAGIVALLCAGAAACGSSSSTTSKTASATTSSAAAATTSSSTAAATTTAATAGSKSPITFSVISWKLPGSDILTAFSAGAQAAAKQINASGGFGGHPVSLNVCNSMLEQAAATACAHSTIAAHPVAMFGCDLYWFAAGLPVYSAAHIPSVNCPNAPTDFTNPYSFGVNASAIGEDRAIAKYACSQPSIKTFVTIVYDDPADHLLFGTAEQPVLKACGKTAVAVYFPETATDVATYTQKVIQAKPDFVLINASDVAVIQIYKALGQGGIPASHIATPDNNFTYQDISQAHGALTGGIAIADYAPWSDTSDLAVAAYMQALQGSTVDPRNATVEWGYSDLMFLYNVAKEIGFSDFNSSTLQHFLSTKSFSIPLSTGAFINPGPTGVPQAKQPYVRLTQWTGSEFKFVTGRINGY